MSKIEISKVFKRFGDAEVIHGVDMSLPHGELTVFVGPSGCGKSTLLRMIAGLEEISDGEIRIDDIVVNDLPPSRRGVAMVFQSYALYPHMTVFENVAFGLTLAKTPKDEIRQRVDHVADLLQITSLLDRKPKALSGGQRQRVAIGRAIIRSPGVFLFDEPLSNLDAALRVQMRIEIARLHGEIDASMVYVTHDQVEAMTLADRIVVLRDGRIEQIGSPMELYASPANTFVGGFIGSPAMSFVNANVEQSGGTGKLNARFPGGAIEIDPAGLAIPSKALILGIRPEHLAPSASGNGSLSAKVLVTERLGGENVVHVALEDGSALKYKCPPDHAPEPGSAVSLDADPDHVYLFDTAEKALFRPA